MTIAEAVTVVRDRWGEFVALERALLDLEHRGALAVQQARAAGDADGEAAARASMARFRELKMAHADLVNRIETLADRIPGLFPGVGLGVLPAIPVYLVASVLAAAAALLLWINRYRGETMILETIEDAIAGVASGELTPAEAGELLERARALLEQGAASRPPTPLGALAGDLLKFGALAAALYVFVRGAGGTRSW